MKRVIKSLVKYVLCAATGAGVAAVVVEDKKEKEKANLNTLSNKHLTLFRMMCDWVKLLQEGKSVKDYVKAKGYRKVAIYGMSYVGDCLVAELKNQDLELLYGIDSADSSVWSNIPVVDLDDEMDDVDVVIVTPVTSFDSIKAKIKKYFDCPIVSMEDVLYEIRRM